MEDKETKNVTQKEIKKEIDVCNGNIKNSESKIFIYNLAIKGLLGDLSEYVLEKLLEIASAIRDEQLNIKWQERRLKELQENK